MAMASMLLIQILIGQVLSSRILSVARGALHVTAFAGVFEALRSFVYGFAHGAAPVAVTALWQGAVVAAGLAICLQFAPRVAAAHRFAAWAAGFGVLVALPFVPALSSLLSRLVAAIAGSSSNAGSSIGAASLPSPAAHSWLAHPLLAINDHWSLAIAVLWVMLALVRAVDLAIHAVRLRRLWKNATPVGMDEALRAILVSEGDTQQKHFELCTTRELDRPSVIGFFAPRILIPEWLFERLTRQELEQVVLHEAEHLRRRDDWTNLLQKLCLVVFPLNPALAFIERNLCREREMACDEGVVRRTQAPRAYAACLAGLAERHMEHRAAALSLGARAKALTLSAFERRPELARRVHSILLRRGALHPVASRALVGAVGCALAVGAVMLARCPQLVAFVPAEPRVTVEAAQMVPADLRRDERVASTSPDQMAASHFRAINAMAIVPDTTQRVGTRRAATVYKAGPHTRESKFRQTLASAPGQAGGPDTVAYAVNSATPVPQELIVLTAFEQVQAEGDVLGDRVVSDYGADTASNARPADGGAGRVTITRLIFRVITPAAGATTQSTNQANGKPAKTTDAKPAGQVTQPDANSRDANSLTGQPHAVALGNGWFVIQL